MCASVKAAHARASHQHRKFMQAIKPGQRFTPAEFEQLLAEPVEAPLIRLCLVPQEVVQLHKCHNKPLGLKAVSSGALLPLRRQHTMCVRPTQQHT